MENISTLGSDSNLRCPKNWKGSVLLCCHVSSQCRTTLGGYCKTRTGVSARLCFILPMCLCRLVSHLTHFQSQLSFKALLTPTATSHSRGGSWRQSHTRSWCLTQLRLISGRQSDCRSLSRCQMSPPCGLDEGRHKPPKPKPMKAMANNVSPCKSKCTMAAGLRAFITSPCLSPQSCVRPGRLCQTREKGSHPASELYAAWPGPCVAPVPPKHGTSHGL